ncbi:MAG: alanyl-tRNA synthetase [Gaiellaceae bacterium]|nr:alanyl-tRNA synthetase [Gaiellaceae bacterium]MDX6493629.1 alanyl-tRNA synthetase [Gaiellaceae bacterium]
MRTTQELRAGYRAFYESKGHTFHPSWSLIPRSDDHSTLLNSAGMQPLMPFFLGREQPPAPLLTTLQKCFRTPDIDEVGLDGHHLTYFEMLGNFSFGQYFKEGAIELAWEFLTEHMRIDMSKLWVSVFAGDPELKLGEDEVTVRLWETIGQPPERIVRLPRSENFWSVGGPGPCGPDSELYYDRGEEIGCGQPDCAPACTRCERFLEFWNLVFMEYELHSDGSLTPLPTQNIDTGMGLERTASVLQGVISVYETDGYQDIMRWIEAESGVGYGSSDQATKAHRILADHGRGMTFLAGEGIAPSNEGRGYVMRRIVRRAVLQAGRIGLESPFLARLSDVVIDQMDEAYPELGETRTDIHRILTAEEERFSETLQRGMRLFEEIADAGEISGEAAFMLHDTYGFPLELTQELARERGLGVNEEEFTSLMARQRERSRAAVSKDDQRAAEFSQAAGFRTEFVGYEKTDVLTQLGALEELGDGLFLAKLRESPFYPAGGGQVTDAGYVELDDGSGTRADLREAYRLEDDQVLVFEGSGFKAGDRVRAVVPWPVRFPTMANHTATHLLHKALQEVLGDHVKQAGSAVRPDKLRFDFTHTQALSAEEREQIEQRVNEKVFESLPVRIFETPIDEARKLGATMLFGEKYGDVVRVVEIDGYSRELCGGTHVRTTAEVGPFAILTEGSVGAGSRRIEAVTSGEAYALLHARTREADELRAELEQARKAVKRPAGESTAARPDILSRDGDGRVVMAEVKDVKGGTLRDLSDQLRQQEKALAVVLGSVDDGRVFVVINLDPSLEEQGLDAVAVVRALAPIIGGGGGGRPGLAEAGGKDPARLREALEAGRDAVVAALP